MGRRLCFLPRNFFSILDLKMASFGALSVPVGDASPHPPPGSATESRPTLLSELTNLQHEFSLAVSSCCFTAAMMRSASRTIQRRQPSVSTAMTMLVHSYRRYRQTDTTRGWDSTCRSLPARSSSTRLPARPPEFL